MNPDVWTALLAIVLLPIGAARAEESFDPFVGIRVGGAYGGYFDVKSVTQGKVGSLSTGPGLEFGATAGLQMGWVRSGLDIGYANLPIRRFVVGANPPESGDQAQYVSTLFEVHVDLPIIEDRLDATIGGGFGAMGQFADFASNEWDFAYRGKAGLFYRPRGSVAGLEIMYAYTGTSRGFSTPILAEVGGSKLEVGTHSLGVGIRFTFGDSGPVDAEDADEDEASYDDSDDE